MGPLANLKKLLFSTDNAIIQWLSIYWFVPAACVACLLTVIAVRRSLFGIRFFFFFHSCCLQPLRGEIYLQDEKFGQATALQKGPDMIHSADL